MSPFVDRNRRNVGINVNRVGERIVVITAEQPPGQQSFTDHAEHSKGIPPAGSHGLIGHQTFPVIAGAILIQPHFDRIQFVALQISRDGVFCFPTDGMIFDAPIEQDQFGRNPPDPAKSVDHRSTSATFNLRCRDGGQFGCCFPDSSRSTRVGLRCTAT